MCNDCYTRSLQLLALAQPLPTFWGVSLADSRCMPTPQAACVLATALTNYMLYTVVQKLAVQMGLRSDSTSSTFTLAWIGFSAAGSVSGTQGLTLVLRASGP